MLMFMSCCHTLTVYSKRIRAPDIKIILGYNITPAMMLLMLIFRRFATPPFA